MKRIKTHYPLYLKKTKEKGWGVYCSKRITKGKVFETCPIIYLPRKLIHKFSGTPVDSYRFEYYGNTTALVLGYGSLYNHSKKQANCDYRINRKSKTFSFYATKDIPADTEILHDYNWDKDDYETRAFAES
ncbi:MAG: SET domain-containing protein-lysine N-methyltransferase [Oligoflexia bacterium]|nr:SET domain-containing protein-lysine N-methyltransferase [Oligoflexia bacterium]